MKLTARLVVAVVALFSLAMGLTALFAPQQAGAAVGLVGLEPPGLSTVRADIGAFFLACAIACCGALALGRSGWLYGAALLYGLAALGRTVGVLMAGVSQGAVAFIAVELVLVAALVFGARALGPGRAAER